MAVAEPEQAELVQAAARALRLPQRDATSSSTVSATRNLPGSWLRYPARPRSLTRPALGTSSPAASFASVVLPTPFGPTSATTSPRRSASDSLDDDGRAAGIRERHAVEGDDIRAVPRAASAGSGARSTRRQFVDGDAVAHEDDAIGELERQLRPLLGDDDGASLCARVLEDRARRVRIELRRRLVQQQQLRLERERRREADALQLAARELRDRTLGEMLRTDGLPARAARAARSAPAACRGSPARTTPRRERASARPAPRAPGTPSRPCRRAAPDASSACRVRRRPRDRRSGRRGNAARARPEHGAASTCRSPRRRAMRRTRPARSRARRRRPPDARRPDR